MPDANTLADFIARWSASGGNELANAQPFLKELCEVLDLPRHEAAKDVNEDNAYSFERKVRLPLGDGKTELKRLDLYKRGCFVLEAKQGKETVARTPLTLPMHGLTQSSAVKRGTRAWEDTMARAKRQAETYVRALPAGEGRPPFIIVADVGHCFDLYAEFSCTGGIYIPFPDQRTSRTYLPDLAKPEVQALFKALWEDPLSLDPSRRAARVTTEIAGYLAALAKSLEADGHDSDKVGGFLIRCLFTMFAEDVGLLTANSFQDMLARASVKPDLFPPLVQDLWTAMNAGSVSVALGERLKRFNGNIFAKPEVLPLSGAQIAILLEAAKADWREVEPAIFGTLLERALSTRDRHKLGAHYTPRAYVERLVLPTVITPLREEWHDVQAAASMLGAQGKVQEAQAEIAAFLRRLCALRILDPACGSGNFLYVTLEHMKRLEGEVLAEAASFGEFQRPLEAQGLTVDPHQFLGLELNPRAAHIAEMVLWIGYLQWHFRTHGTVAPPEPIIRTFHNIENRDALIACNGFQPVLDGAGQPVTRWDGQTKKTDPVTGREVPDDSARVAENSCVNPISATWPDADYIVGNPPFIGGGMKRAALGSGYFTALTSTYTDLPESCDFVMYWWHKAAALVREGRARRFGFITTNSLGQVFNRRVTAMHMAATPPLSLAYAIPDHPWVDAADGAAVRIAMTVGQAGAEEGNLARVVTETATEGVEVHVLLSERVGRINADLTIGADVASAAQLKANAELSCRGVSLHGSGFIVTPEEAAALGLGRVAGLEKHIRPYRHGRDIADKPRGVLVIDLFGLTEDAVRERFPEVYQWLLERVKPDRDASASRSKDSAQYAAKWWLFGKPRETFRPALAGLPRFISTPETAKHRFFVFQDETILPDNMLVNIATDDAYHLGVLSSRIHVVWALAAGGTLEDRPRYNKTPCFETFPFPDPTPEMKARIRDLGERLDAHRKARQALFPDVRLTAMYNVLVALRVGRELSAQEREVHEHGLVRLLNQLHVELDRAVAEAYGWPVDLPDAEILERLVALNRARAEEEKTGHVRWLRPEYQCRDKSKPAKQAKLGIAFDAKPKKKGGKPTKRVAKVLPRTWPATLPEQFQAVRSVLASFGGPASAEQVAKAYARAPRAKVQEILETLAAQGFVRQGEGGEYRAA